MNLDSIIQYANNFQIKYQKKINNTICNNLGKVLTAFRNYKVADFHFNSSTGYGYNDAGRDTLEKIFAQIFCTEDALIRHQIISGTHAINLCLTGNLLPGDELLSIGRPYDTLQKIVGTEKKEPGTLRELGITYKEFPVQNGNIDIVNLLNIISIKTKIVSLQRSRGYEWRPSYTISDIKKITSAIKSKFPHVIIFVDNCYGEFVEEQEPTEVGVDLIAGSLIKNPGGGIAPGGGYIAGRKELVERASYKLTVPGIGKEIGPSLANNRLFYQGLFYAPHIVGEALCGAVLTSTIFSELGFEVLPEPNDFRTDIIQAVKLKTPKRVIHFCQGIQKYSPVDSYVTPEPWGMPGYQDPVIMAAGGFVQGSSIELSADAPIREPYIVFIQGGASRHHVRLALTETLKEMSSAGLL